jgi:hypothetical protein
MEDRLIRVTLFSPKFEEVDERARYKRNIEVV